MENSDTLALANAEEPASGQESPRTAPLTSAQRNTRWRQRHKDEVARMKRITQKAERLNDALLKVDTEQLTLPMSLIDENVETTLDNLRQHIATIETAREAAQTRKKGVRKKHNN